jgi:O-antigen ligase
MTTASTAPSSLPQRASALLLAASGMLGAICVLAGLLTPNWSKLSLACLLLIPLTCLRPVPTLCLLCCSLALFGNRATSGQFIAFFLVAGALSTGLALAYTRRLWQALTPLPKVLQWALLYVMVSILSLTSLPLGSLIQEGWGLVAALLDAYQTRSSLGYAIESVLLVPENTYSYSIITVALTLFAWSLAASLSLLCREYPHAPRQLAFSCLIGLLLTLAAGFADYFSLINLRSLRALDPTVNAGDIQFRMQSFFGHSGWFAEYLTLCAPFALILLTLNLRYSLRVSLIILLLVVIEIALILSYQRGGWLSYPLTLLVVWFAIYAYRSFERQEFFALQLLRRASLKVLVSLPLTVLASVLLMRLAASSGLVDAKSLPSAERYLERAADITRTSDRSEFLIAGMKLGVLSPIFGSGSELFALRFEQQFENPQGLYYRQAVLPLHGSAHNIYAQTFSGKGGVGLICLLGLCLSSLYSSFRAALSSNQCSAQQRMALLTSGCLTAAFLIYGNVQEIFYIPSLQHLFFLSVGLAAQALPQRCNQQRSSLFSVGLAFLCILFAAHLYWQYHTPGRTSVENMRSFGCYGQEQTAQGELFRWCAPFSRVVLPVEHSLPVDHSAQPAAQDSASVRLRLRYPLETPATLRVSQGPRLLYSGELRKGMVLDTILKGVELQAGKALIEIQTSAVLIPIRDIKSSRDRRLLAVQLLESTPA